MNATDFPISSEIPNAPIPVPPISPPAHAPGTVNEYGGSCDWGCCSLPSIGWRYGGDSHEWLPVCTEHLGAH